MLEVIDCPHCGYVSAMHQIFFSDGEEYLHCARCGYCDRCKYSKYSSNRKESHSIEGGNGCFIHRKKGTEPYTYGAMEEDTIDHLIKNLDSYDYCKYTFARDGHWYLKNLLNDTETFFNGRDFWYGG